MADTVAAIREVLEQLEVELVRVRHAAENAAAAAAAALKRLTAERDMLLKRLGDG